VGSVCLLLGTLDVTGRILTSLAFTGVTDSVRGFWSARMRDLYRPFPAFFPFAEHTEVQWRRWGAQSLEGSHDHSPYHILGSPRREEDG
jgi:hypothetical protein